jgi:flagellar hook-length control protein FliK
VALEITAHLQSPLGNPSPLSAPLSTAASPDSSSGFAAGDKSAAQNSNALSAASGSSDAVKAADSGSGSFGASHSGAGDAGSPNATSDAFAAANATAANAANAAGLIANATAPGDTSRHAAAESLAPPASPADPSSGGAAAAASRPASATLFASQQPPLASALPTSLGDVAQASRLYQRVGGAEMHIAMDTDFLGSIDLRAVVHQSALTASIGVQHADVQALLSSELPGLQHALSQKNLHVEQISIFGGAVGSQSNQSGNPQQKNNPPFTPQAAAVPWGSASDARERSAAAADTIAAVEGAGRLSVHA